MYVCIIHVIYQYNSLRKLNTYSHNKYIYIQTDVLISKGIGICVDTKFSN